MKLTDTEIMNDGLDFLFIEGMKHRFKIHYVPYPMYYSELIWDDVRSETGYTKKELRSKKSEAVKPYWRKKRRLQKRSKKQLHANLMRLFDQQKDAF